MFRARPNGVWHFCVNCPTGRTTSKNSTTTTPMSIAGQWCKVCLRLDGTGKADYEEPSYSLLSEALNRTLKGETRCSCGGWGFSHKIL